MLTASQVRTVAYLGECEFYCRECVEKDYSALALDRLDEGLFSAAEDRYRPVSQYELDTHNGERASEYKILRADDAEADWLEDDEAGPFRVTDYNGDELWDGEKFASYEAADDARDALAAEHCGGCDCEL